MQLQREGQPLHFLKDDIYICATQRAGSSSIIRSLGAFRVVNERLVAQHPERRSVMWIRNPWDRLASNTIVSKPKDIDNWVNKRVLLEYNAHWQPQTEIHTYEGKPLWNELYLFDDFQETWPNVFPEYTLEHIRHSPNRIQANELLKELKPSTIQKLEDYYKDDLELYEHQSKLAIQKRYG